MGGSAVLVGARPQDLNAALNVSYICIMHVLGFSLCSALHHLNFTLKTCLDKGILLITLEVKFRMVYLL